VKKDLNKYLD
jgi:hypothetical protein